MKTFEATHIIIDGTHIEPVMVVGSVVYIKDQWGNFEASSWTIQGDDTLLVRGQPPKGFHRVYRTYNPKLKKTFLVYNVRTDKVYGLYEADLRWQALKVAYEEHGAEEYRKAGPKDLDLHAKWLGSYLG